MTRVIMLNQNNVHIDGYKEIISLNSDCITVSCNRKNLKVIGNDLNIEAFTGVNMTVKGCIKSIAWE